MKFSLRWFYLSALLLPLPLLADVTYTGSAFPSGGSTYVGYNAAGDLTITATGSPTVLTTTGYSYIGYLNGGIGTATVTGSGAQWLTPNNTMFVGTFSGSSGLLSILNGGYVQSSYATLGYDANTSGEIDVTGAGSQWTMGGSTFATLIGNNGSGILKLQSGGVATIASSIYVTSNTGSTGAITVDGVGSQLNANGGLYFSVSANTTATMGVTNGGKVVSTETGLYGTDTVTVDGSGSTFNTGNLVIGNSGNSALNISNGGVVNSGNTTLGYTKGAVSGTATLAGTNSQWNVAGTMTVGGSSSTGSVTVSDGALLSVVNTGINVATGTANNVLTLGASPQSSNPGETASTGTLTIGTGGAAGQLSLDQVFGWYSTSTNPPFVPGNATLAFNTNDTGYIFQNTSGQGILVSGSTKITNIAGTTILNSANTNTGTTSITGGTILLENSTGSGLGTGAITVGAAGALQAGIGGTAGSFTGNVADSGSLIFNRSDDVTYAGVISGAGNVTQAGPNTLTLTGTNTFTGTTTVNSGGFQIGAGGTIGSYAGNIINNGVVTFNRSNALSYGGAISGTGSVVKTGAGVLTLTGASSYQGGTSLNAGLVNFSNGNNFGSGNLTFNGGGLQWGASNTTDLSSRFNAIQSGGATFDTNGNNVTFASALSGTGGITKTGTGNLTLGTANSYQGDTTITGGLINFTNGNNFGTGNITFNGGGLQWGTSTTTDISSRFNAIQSGGATFDTNGNNVTLATVLSGTGGVTKAGSGVLTLGVDETYSGVTTVSAGTLSVNHLANGGLASSIGNSSNAAANLVLNGATLQYTGAGDSTDRGLTVGTTGVTFDGSGTGTIQFAGTGAVAYNTTNTAKTFTFTGSNTGSNNFAGIIGNNGTGLASVVKNGAGTWQLTGLNTYTGTTTINGGILNVNTMSNAGSASNIGSAASNLVINGGTLQFTGSSGTTNRSFTLGTLGGTLDGSGTGALIFNSSAGLAFSTPNVAETLTLAGSYVSGTTDNALYATLANNGTGLTSVIKNDAGAWDINAANSYTGGTTLNAGTLGIGNNAALGTGALVVNGGTIRAVGGFARTINNPLTLNSGFTLGRSMTFGGNAALNADITITADNPDGAANANSMFSGVISGNYGVTIATGANGMGTGAIVFDGINTYNGGTTISSGGVLQIGNLDGVNSSIAGNIIDNGSLIYNLFGATSNSGAISGTGSVTQKGSNTLTLSGTNSYQGGTSIVSSSSLRAVGASSLGTGTVTFSSSGGTLTLASDTAANFGNAVVLTSSTNFLYSDRITAGAGVVQTLGALSLGGNTLILKAGTNVTSGTAGLTFGATTLTGDTSFNITSSILTLASVSGSGNITEAGNGGGQFVIPGTIATGTGSITVSSGTLTLSGNNSYSGGTSIGGATTVNATNSNALGTGNVAVNGTLQLSGDSALTLGNTVSSSSGGTFASDRLTNGAGVTHNLGALTAGNNVFTSIISVNAGSHVTSGTAGISFTSAVLNGDLALNIANSAQLTLGSVTGTDTNLFIQAGYNGNLNIIGNIDTGAGFISLQSNSIVTLSGTNSYSGGTYIFGGTMKATNNSALGTDVVYLGGGWLNLASDSALHYSNNVEVGYYATIFSDRATAGAGVTHIIDTMLFDDAYSLTVSKGANVTSGTAGLSIGAVTLTTDGASFAPDSGVQLTIGTITGTDTGWSNNGNGAITVTGAMSLGAGSVSQNGGTLTLNSSNSYSGGTDIASGTLRITNSGAMGSGNIAMDGGTLTLADDTGLTLSNASTVPTNSTITSDRLTSGAGITHTLGTLSIGARTLTVNKGANVSSGTAGITYGAVTLTGNATFKPSTGTLLTLASVTGTNRSFSDTGAGNLTIPGIIATGSGTVTQSGTGNLTLNGTNTYTGGFTATGGTTTIGNTKAFGTGTLTLNGGTIKGDGSDYTLANVISLAAASTISGASNLTFSGALTNSLTANTLTNNGTGDLSLAAINISNSNTARGITFAGTGDTEITGVIANGGTGAGAITKTGAGTLTLSGTANTYTGVTTITSGILSTATFAAGGSNSGIGKAPAAGGNIVLNGGTLQYTGAAVSTDRLFTVTTGGGALDASGTGAVNFSNTGALLYTTTGARTLTLTGTNTGANTLASILANGPSTSVTAMTKTGAGKWILSGANTYTGVTTVTAGTLSTASFANGGTASGIGKATNAGGNLVLNGGTLQYTGAAVSTNRLFTVTASGGALDASGSGAVNFTGTGPTLFSGSGTRTLTLTGSNAGANTLAAVLGDGTGGATSLTKTGDGTWVLSGANTYTGLVNVSDGLLSINAIAANGTAQPLGKGTGAITLGDTATLRYTSNSAATLARALTVSAGTGTISNTGSGVLTLSGTLTKANTVLAFSGGKFDISGQITGGTGSTFNSDLVINNATDITLDNTNNDYAGPTYVYGGAALRNGANNVLPLGTTLTLGDATDGAVTNTYDLNTHTQSIGAITSVSHGGNINKITNAGSSAATLTLTGIQGAITPVSSNFGGTLVDGLSGTTALTLSGGTHKFTGANTYSGGTTVAAGAKFIASNTTGSATGVGNVNIAVGATLAGSGILAPTGTNSITVLGTLAPGDIEVINTLSLDGSSNSAAHLLTLGTGATLEFDLDVSLASDRIALLSNSVGGISFNDNVINFTDLSDGNLAYGSYTLFTAPNLTDYSGLTVDGNGNIIGGLTIGTGVSDFNANLSYSGNNIVLNLAAVPEPSTWLLLVIGFSGLFFVRKKKFVKIL